MKIVDLKCCSEYLLRLYYSHNLSTLLEWNTIYKSKPWLFKVSCREKFLMAGTWLTWSWVRKNEVSFLPVFQRGIGAFMKCVPFLTGAVTHSQVRWTSEPWKPASHFQSLMASLNLLGKIVSDKLTNSSEPVRICPPLFEEVSHTSLSSFCHNKVQSSLAVSKNLWGGELVLCYNFSPTVSSKIALKSFNPTVTSHRWLLCIFFSLTRLSRVNSKSTIGGTQNWSSH